MAKHLMIVESPAKAKTIEKYLGKDFIVRASYGHVRDLIKGDAAIDVENGFSPTYEILPDKIKVINELKGIIKETETVWLATDEDREGESISWHLAEALGLNIATTHRVVFNEITKNAITKAVQKPRTIDLPLVDAQQARRILDRLVGFDLSSVLWRKVKQGLSAGRVQSVAVKLLVEREREILNFKSVSSFKVNAEFHTDKKEIVKSELTRKIEKEADALAFLESCKHATYKVTSLETKPTKRTPAPPFTTSTLQQEASRKLSFSVASTMRVAQSLYESGKITYMRTDSVNLSDTALQEAEAAVNANFGNKYHQLRKFKNKNANAQEAHEAIRPTDFSLSQVEGNKDEQRLYELIWKRAMASQMADAQLERTVVDITASSNQAVFRAIGEVIVFDGFLKLYRESSDEEDEDENSILPPLKIGQVVDLNIMKAVERFTRPSARYTEASLVKKMEELGIGRPSTYAPTISTIQAREYVTKENRDGVKREYQIHTLKQNTITSTKATENVGQEKNKLFPTDLGMLVTDFLNNHFTKVMDYSFTAGVEEEFDKIAENKLIWNQMIANFYGDFNQTVASVKQDADRAKSERLLGEDPESGKPVFARLSKNGPVIQIGDGKGEEKPRFAGLRPNQRLETITFEEAMALFVLPRKLGEFEDQVVKAAIGKFGPYVQVGKTFVSLKTDSPYEVSLERAIELYHAKLASDESKIVRIFNDEVKIVRGLWNRPYLKIKTSNITLPKDIDVDSLTLDDCYRLQEEADNKPSAKKNENAIQDFGNIQILNGKYGAYIKKGKTNYKIPKDKQPDTLTKEECEQIIAAEDAKPKKKK